MARADAALHWLCRAVSPLTQAGDVTPLAPADWPLVMRLADWHMLLPELYLAALRHGDRLGVPQEMLETLEAFHFLNNERNDRLRAQMRHLSRAFSNAGIRHVWLKGAVWLLEDQGGPSGRMMSDLDLWLPDRASHPAALQLLADLGFHRLPGQEDADWHMSHHYAPRFSDDWPARVEPHHHIIDPRFAGLLPDEKLLDAVRWVEWEGAKIGIPGTTDRILHAMVQASVMAIPSFGTGRTPLMKGFDVVRLCAQHNGGALPDEVAAWVGRPEWESWSRPLLGVLQPLFGLSTPLATDTRVYRRLCLSTRWPRLALLIETWARVVDGKLFRRLARPRTLPNLIRIYIRILRSGLDTR